MTKNIVFISYATTHRRGLKGAKLFIQAHKDKADETKIWLQPIDYHQGENNGPNKPWHDPDHPSFKRITLSPTEASTHTDKIFRKLPKISTALPFNENCGFDGTDYLLDIAFHSSSITYRWWSNLPPEWESLGPLVRQLEQLLRTITSQHAPQSSID